MRLETREGDWDLFGIMIFAFAFSLEVVLLPELSLIRILLGIPFLVFFPGYVLTALLFPRKNIEASSEEDRKKRETTPDTFPGRNLRKAEAA